MIATLDLTSGIALTVTESKQIAHYQRKIRCVLIINGEFSLYFSIKTYVVEYSLKQPQQGSTNEYPDFLSRNTENYPKFMSRDMTKTNKVTVCPAKTRQPGHPTNLIWFFSVSMKEAWVVSDPLSAHRRLIRLGKCPGWSVFPGHTVTLLNLSCCGSYHNIPNLYSVGLVVLKTPALY